MRRHVLFVIGKCVKYNPSKIEKKWQKYWEENGTFKDYSRPEKFYALDMFPYPSGEGLHVGHPKGYIATDVVARFEQLRGKSVLHPMGWDAFGLPAENYAIKNKVHPAEAVRKNIKRFKEQLQSIGFTYDWDREINTTDPEYYTWTQWIFLKMFERGLAYESYEPINWCPSCKTGLANEDLENGKCERCGSEIEQKPMRQWVLKMTEYADRLLRDLDTENLDWEKSIVDQQKNWIGRSEGATVKFEIVQSKYKKSPTPLSRGLDTSPQAGEVEYVEVFTTRVDTIFGCTYVVVAPEHKLIENIKEKIENISEVEEYIEQAKKKTNLQRTDLAKEKTGVKLEGVSAVNPFNGEAVPVFVADYVLGSYGTGAVMAVPAHDERDLEFAKKHELPVRVVVKSAKDYENIRTASLESLIKIIFTKSKEDDFLAILVGGVAHALRENGKLGKHSDIDVFVDRKGFEVLEKYFVENGYNSATRDGKTDFHEWNNHKWFWKDGEWVDLFIAEEEGGILFDKVGFGKNAWGKRDEVVIHKDFDGVTVAIPTEQVIEKIGFSLSHSWNYCFTDRGILAHSGEYTGMDSGDAKEKMTEWLEKTGNGKRTVNYKMRDWVFSRQRYWGEPIPIISCPSCKKLLENSNFQFPISNHKEEDFFEIDGKKFSRGEILNPGSVGVPEDQLPIRLPEVDSYEPTGTGESPLAMIESWVSTTCPKCGGPAKRETNTMPQWAGSSWYYLSYIMKGDPNFQLPTSKFLSEWLPVDLYVGGAEHATRHLLYARFWHKFLYDIGVVSTKEPFKRLVHVGLINAEDGRKMSKRWNNVINPDDVIAEFGADSLRLYEMFMGPFTQSIAWNTEGVSGVRRFLDKVWRLSEKVTGDSEQVTVNKEVESLLHKTIKKVTEDIEAFRFNTAISSLMILVNRMEKEEFLLTTHYSLLTLLLSPFAPHIAEELWEKMGNITSIFLESWPSWDENLIQDETITLVVQVNGKVRDRLDVSANISEEDARKRALASENVKKFVEGKEIRKVIFVKGKLVNIVL